MLPLAPGIEYTRRIVKDLNTDRNITLEISGDLNKLHFWGLMPFHLSDETLIAIKKDLFREVLSMLSFSCSSNAPRVEEDSKIITARDIGGNYARIVNDVVEHASRPTDVKKDETWSTQIWGDKVE